MSPSNPKWTLKLFNLTEKLMSTKPKTFLKTKPKLFNQTKTSSSTKNQTFSTKLTDQANKSPNFVQLHQTNKSPNGINTRTVSSSFRRAKKTRHHQVKKFRLWPWEKRGPKIGDGSKTSVERASWRLAARKYAKQIDLFVCFLSLS